MEQELRISQRAKQYPASGIRKMFDLAAQYPEAIKLTVGEPNFDTPQYIKDAAKRALDEGQTHYAPNAGTTELREAVAAKYRKQYWEGYTKDHVIITVGAMEGLFLAMMTLLDPGDEILVPDPCFPNYYGQASSIGARAVPSPRMRNMTTGSKRRISKRPSHPDPGDPAELPLQSHRRGADEGGHPGLSPRWRRPMTCGC